MDEFTGLTLSEMADYHTGAKLTLAPPKGRKKNDLYPTPEWATKVLLQRLPAPAYEERILEPCVGDGAIYGPMLEHFKDAFAFANDIDHKFVADWHYDAAEPEFWEKFNGFDYIITNPPFSQAQEIVSLAHLKTRKVLACLLRLSFLEPTKERGEWLKLYPPTHIIVLPRISFTGDGKTDSVTCAWMIWDRAGVIPAAQPPIEIVQKKALPSVASTGASTVSIAQQIAGLV